MIFLPETRNPSDTFHFVNGAYVVPAGKFAKVYGFACEAADLLLNGVNISQKRGVLQNNMTNGTGIVDYTVSVSMEATVFYKATPPNIVQVAFDGSNFVDLKPYGDDPTSDSSKFTAHLLPGSILRQNITVAGTSEGIGLAGKAAEECGQAVDTWLKAGDTVSGGSFSIAEYDIP